eukprot:CAMPEP_0198284580 /NCGR_PEP_ID=MMETSP1449-20131203/4034_1 /TAXON_ID=420275 /ORGANISM="Attheya septentrionalis, Strain CCMP2084" /LENGTH=364 /DNA_ID=CAMNT_0043981711 /DNA_START=266 /DNA_END=1360 /DNA_ORIENTATION=+
MKIPVLITASVLKKDVDEKTGAFLKPVFLTEGDGEDVISNDTEKQLKGICVSCLIEDSLFGQSKLMVGDYLVSINGFQCNELSSATEAANIIREAVGEIRITAVRGGWSPQVVIASATKPIHHGLTGITLHPVCDGLVRIKRIQEHGLFGNSKLSKGDILVTANGIPITCHSQAGQLLRNCRESLTIIAISPSIHRRILVDEMFGSALKITWKSPDECELKQHQQKYLLIFGENGIAQYVDISSGRPLMSTAEGRYRSKLESRMRQLRISFVRQLVQLNDRLSRFGDICKIVLNHTQVPVAVEAELVVESENNKPHHSLTDNLRVLADMKRDGLLSEQEFSIAKSNILGTTHAPLAEISPMANQ